VAEQAVKFSATGRRKTAVARVCLAPGAGKNVVNGQAFKDYFKTESLLQFIAQPLTLANAADRYDITASVRGGGIAGQAGALRHGLARALVLADAQSKDALKSSGCLTRDPRMRERKKAGRPGARKRFQFSKR
jgi:small subunit ribosomal protein S9